MKNKYFYKVTTKELTSIVMSEQSANKNLILQYELNKWTYPIIKNSKCFVFSRKARAIQFASTANRYRNCLVFSCIVKKPKLSKRLSSLHNCTLKNIKMFWSDTRYHTICKDDIKLYETTMESPSFTYSCDAVKLIEEVK